MTTSHPKNNAQMRPIDKNTMVHAPSIPTPRWNKAALREELSNEVERWLEQGNEITIEPDAQNDRNGRRVEIHGGGYYF